MPRFPVTALRSVDLGTPDLDLSLKFYCEVWGLERVASAADVIYLRASGSDHHVVALHTSERPELRAVTFRVAQPGDFGSIAANAALLGAYTTYGPFSRTGTMLTAGLAWPEINELNVEMSGMLAISR